MSRLMFSALLLTSCAAEVAPRADAGDPRVMPVGAVAELDGSFSEGEGLSYAWAVTPEGATILDSASPFATLIADAPGLYTLSLEVCDESGRCDVAETWARVDAPGSANKVSDWGLGEFAGAESGAGAPLEAFTADKAWCKKCYDMIDSTAQQWEDFCMTGLPRDATSQDKKICSQNQHETSSTKRGYCDARCAK
jgi:hypothetical protein